MINKQIKIQKTKCKINLKINYYYNKPGLVKGIKKLHKNNYLYLVEFFDGNRIWILQQEIIAF